VSNVSTAQNRQLRSSQEAAHLHIRLLGPVTIIKNGGSVAIPSKKGRALLGYLALREGTEVSRSVLTGLLWGERSESAARASLRQTLSELRSALGGSAQHSMVANKETVTWVSGSASIDAKVLESAAGSKDEAAIREAAELIRGELMEGLSVNEASFEQWLASERERFRLIACSIYERLSEAAKRDAKLEEALNFGLKLLALDPLQEHVHRTLMRLYAAQGRHDAALAQYERCRRELSAQLAAAPQPETEQLARAIRVGRRDGAAKPQISAPAAVEPEEGNTLARPDRPSIAVLPFTNLSSDAEQQYFSDGITEDIITELSRYHSLLVIARNSCFQFRGSSADTAAVRRALGVRYIVEGSIRKMGNRIRVTVQLIDAVTQTHVWAERYEPIANDIFAVQDEIARAVASTLEGRVAASGAEYARRKPTNDWAAHDYFLQGREQFHRYHFVEAEPFFARAVELDHGYAQAYALRAGALVGRYWNDLKPDTMDEAMSCAQRALSLDDTDPWCQMMMGFVLTHRGQRDLAGPYFDRAIALNPADVQIAYMRAWWLVRVGRAKEALETLDIAFRRDPFPPRWFWEARAIALFVERRYDDVIGALTRMNQLHSWDHAYVAACHAYRGRLTEARAAASDVLKADPHFTISHYARHLGYALPTQLKHLLEGFRKAGLPE
jgi:TolB-like protein